MEKKLLKSHQTNAASIQTVNDLKAANRLLETGIQERLEKISTLEKEKSDMAGKYQAAKIADEMQINELKLMVIIISYFLSLIQVL